MTRGRNGVEQADDAVLRARQQLMEEVAGVERVGSQFGVRPSAPWVRLLAAAGIGLGAAVAAKGLFRRR